MCNLTPPPTVLVEIKELEFDVGMEASLKKLGVEREGKKTREWRGQLRRLEQMMAAKKEELPPVKLHKKCLFTPSRLRKQGIENCSYEIVDGRHRTVAAVARGDSFIRAIVE